MDLNYCFTNHLSPPTYHQNLNLHSHRFHYPIQSRFIRLCHYYFVSCFIELNLFYLTQLNFSLLAKSFYSQEEDQNLLYFSYLLEIFVQFTNFFLFLNFLKEKQPHSSIILQLMHLFFHPCFILNQFSIIKQLNI